MLARLLLVLSVCGALGSNASAPAQDRAAAAQAGSTAVPASQPSPSPIPVPAVPPAAPTPLIAIPASASHVQRIELMRKYPPGILYPAKRDPASHP